MHSVDRAALGRHAALVALLAAASGAGAVQTIEPRAFGYTVGDALERRIRVDPVEEGVLDAASLPRPGRTGRWFALRAVALESGGARLTYQIVNTPVAPAQENLPALRVQVIGPAGGAHAADIGPFTVAMFPVALLGPYDSIQESDLRPDAQPAAIDTVARRKRVLGYAAGLLITMGLWWAPRLAHRLPWRRAGPFARAWKTLRRRRASTGDDGAARRAALRRLHEALDEAAGLTLALDNLDRLFAARPALLPARDAIVQLLQSSRAAFFGQAPPPPVPELAQLARRLADLEARRA